MESCHMQGKGRNNERPCLKTRWRGWRDGSAIKTDSVPWYPRTLLYTAVAGTHNLVLVNISGTQIYMQANTYT